MNDVPEKYRPLSAPFRPPNPEYLAAYVSSLVLNQVIQDLCCVVFYGIVWIVPPPSNSGK